MDEGEEDGADHFREPLLAGPERELGQTYSSDATFADVQAAAKSSWLTRTRILVTRARSQAAALSQALRALGAEVIEIPTIEIRPPASWEPLDESLRQIAAYDWLILTSVNGVQALFSRLEHLGMDTARLARTNIAAIGPATRDAIQSRGLQVAVTPAEYVAESVVAALREQVRSTNVLLIRAKAARDVIPRELSAAGARVHVVEAYETVAPESSRPLLAALLADPGQGPHIITFTSSSTARNFAELAGREAIERALAAGMLLASIGPVTSATLRELGLPVHIEAREYTIPGLVEAIAQRARS